MNFIAGLGVDAQTHSAWKAALPRPADLFFPCPTRRLPDMKRSLRPFPTLMALTAAAAFGGFAATGLNDLMQKPALAALRDYEASRGAGKDPVYRPDNITLPASTVWLR